MDQYQNPHESAFFDSPESGSGSRRRNKTMYIRVMSYKHMYIAGMRIFSASLRPTTRTRESSPSFGLSPTSMRMGASSTTCPGTHSQRNQYHRTSVADSDPPDPHVFGPPGSRSISQRYGSGSGSFYHHAKIIRKTLIPTIFWLFLTGSESGSIS